MMRATGLPGQQSSAPLHREERCGIRWIAFPTQGQMRGPLQTWHIIRMDKMKSRSNVIAPRSESVELPGACRAPMQVGLQVEIPQACPCQPCRKAKSSLSLLQSDNTLLRSSAVTSTSETPAIGYILSQPCRPSRYKPTVERTGLYPI